MSISVDHRKIISIVEECTEAIVLKHGNSWQFRVYPEVQSIMNDQMLIDCSVEWATGDHGPEHLITKRIRLVRVLVGKTKSGYPAYLDLYGDSYLSVGSAWQLKRKIKKFGDEPGIISFFDKIRRESESGICGSYDKGFLPLP